MDECEVKIHSFYNERHDHSVAMVNGNPYAYFPAFDYHYGYTHALQHPQWYGPEYLHYYQNGNDWYESSTNRCK